MCRTTEQNPDTIGWHLTLIDAFFCQMRLHVQWTVWQYLPTTVQGYRLLILRQYDTNFLNIVLLPLFLSRLGTKLQEITNIKNSACSQCDTETTHMLSFSMTMEYWQRYPSWASNFKRYHCHVRTKETGQRLLTAHSLISIYTHTTVRYTGPITGLSSWQQRYHISHWYWFFLSGGQDQSLHLPMEGWPGWVGLSGLVEYFDRSLIRYWPCSKLRWRDQCYIVDLAVF